MKNMKCPCGADIRVRTIEDYRGSKSGHVVYDHVPSPPCERFVATVKTVVAKQRGARIVKS